MNNNCFCCALQGILNHLKFLIPQPFNISGSVKTDCNIELGDVNATITNTPLEISGDITATLADQPISISGTINTNTTISNTPLEVTGTLNVVSVNECAQAMAKILSQSTSFREIVFKNDEQYGNVTNVSVNGSIVTFTSQGQTINTTLCNIEFVVI